VNEADIRRMMQRAFSRAGAYYYHAPDVNVMELRSRPDTIVLSTLGHLVLEVKRVDIKLYKIGEKKGTWDGIFSFKEIRDNQRQLLDSLAMSHIPAFLGLGPVGGRFRIRPLLIIPWTSWANFENDHLENKSAYWSSILREFRDPYVIDFDDGGYFVQRQHVACQALGVGLGSTLFPHYPFEWIDEPISRRLEKKEANGIPVVESNVEE